MLASQWTQPLRRAKPIEESSRVHASHFTTFMMSNPRVNWTKKLNSNQSLTVLLRKRQSLQGIQWRWRANLN